MRVAVIGAGPSGLVALKELLAAGIEAMGFEARAGIGGLFAFDETEGFVWESLRLTSSTLVTQFSDFPAPEGSPLHLRHDQYISYLAAYATRFELWPRLRFHARVEDVRREGDRWSLAMHAQPREEFDAVVVCSGVHQRPFVPRMPGLESFRGEVRHAAEYRRPEPFRGRRVVAVGAGESGGEIIPSVAEVAASCSVSLRRGAYFLPRIVEGMPGDYLTTRLVHGFGPHPSLRELNLARAVLVRGEVPPHPPEEHFELPFKPIVRALFEQTRLSEREQFATKTDALPKAIASDACSVRPEIEAIEGSTIHYVDGSKEEADVLLLCTGFDLPTRPFFGSRPVSRSLYRRILDPEIGPRVAFVGFVRPAIGAIPPIAEMQSRWVAQVLAGRIPIPDADQMRAQIAGDDAWTREAFPKDHEQLPYIVANARYMDELAVDLGCMPKIADLREPRDLLGKFFLSPITTLQYRIAGPGALSDAKQRMAELPVHPKNRRPDDPDRARAFESRE
jgi:dimethylaniline monooxygenase (N-oxide forming) / hypotaurine monooxygenase